MSLDHGPDQLDPLFLDEPTDKNQERLLAADAEPLAVGKSFRVRSRLEQGGVDTAFDQHRCPAKVNPRFEPSADLLGLEGDLVDARKNCPPQARVRKRLQATDEW